MQPTQVASEPFVCKVLTTAGTCNLPGKALVLNCNKMVNLDVRNVSILERLSRQGRGNMFIHFHSKKWIQKAHYGRMESLLMMLKLQMRLKPL